MSSPETAIAKFECRRLVLGSICLRGDRSGGVAFGTGKRGSEVEILLASRRACHVSAGTLIIIGSNRAYSDGANGLRASGFDGRSASHGESMSSSVGVASRLGEATATSVVIENGTL